MSPRPAGDYDYRDERVGKWTRLVECPERVEIWPASTYRRGMYARMVIFAIVAALLARILFSQVELLPVIVLSSVLASMFVQEARARRTMPDLKRPILIIHDARTGREVEQGDVLYAEDIRSVEVRENRGRDAADDMAMWQIYLHCRGGRRPILIHQRPRWRLSREMELAGRLAKRWGAELVDSSRA